MMDRMEPIFAGGRERELESILQEHDLVRGGARRVVIQGREGIGKSHLLVAVARSLEAKGIPTALAGASRASPSSLGIVRELAGRLLDLGRRTGVDPATLARLEGRLGPVLTTRSLSAAAPFASGEAARMGMVDALAELFLVAGHAGGAILLDELDASDRGSLELLTAVVAALAAPGRSDGPLLIVAWREPPSNRLAEAIERLPGSSLSLGSLDVAGVRSFLDEAKLAERLHERSAGVPARLEALLVPREADLGARRLARLDPDARRCLRAAAVLGHVVPAPLLLEVAGGDIDRKLLERLVDDRFLTMSLVHGAPMYGLAREDDRIRLSSSDDPLELEELHFAAGEALEASGGDAEEIARHFLVGDPAGRGAEWAVRAAAALVNRCAYLGAAELYEAALAAKGEPAPEIHLRLSEILEASGDSIGALRHLGLARRYSDPAQARRIRAEAGRICVRIGKISQAARLCARVAGSESELDPADVAGSVAYAAACEARFLAGDYDEAIVACLRGIARTRELPEIRIGLRNTMGKAHLNLGAYDEATEAFSTNGQEALREGLLREQMRALVNEGVVAHRQGDRRRAFERYREARAVEADPIMDALALGNLGALNHEVGEFERAFEHYRSAIASFVRGRRPKEAAHHSLNLARLMLFLGDLDEALTVTQFARGEAASVGDPYLLAQADLLAGEILVEKDEPFRAEAILHLAWGAFEQVGNLRYQVETGLALFRSDLAKGELADARRRLARTMDLTDGQSDALAVELDLAAAELALASGQSKSAGKELERAKARLLARAEGVGGETDLEAPWKTYALLSRLYEAQGDVRGAEADRLRAVRLLEDLAARIPDGKRERFLAKAERARLFEGLEDRELGPERAGALRKVVDASGSSSIIGSSPVLLRLLRSVGPVGRSLAPVLLRGETGTGKERIADELHRASPRRDKALVKVNCAAMNEELLLSELFGHEKGAFTGAVRERKGRFELADGGTIFLDEVGDLSPRAQVALLRVLQEKEFERVGGTQTRRVDVRVIAATNRNLEELIAVGRFREDLYYRLEGVSLVLPPLRERLEDIPALAAHFLGKVVEERGHGPKRFGPKALELLRGWSWPGNVRELENVVGAVSIFAEGDEVDLEAFAQQGKFLELVRSRPLALAAQERGAAGLLSLVAEDPEADVQTGEIAEAVPLDFYALARSRGLGIRELQDEIELQMISRALQVGRGNISEAARLLQMKRSRLSQIVNAEPRLRALTKAV
ncbi:sigma 54-interacting transcriptional regulator [Vulgatibacter incomptus]|uniref:Nitrogenase (Molybdenum-iron)-specific transcriptional regulator NifA n=1 Tax=Vulgatibacter incomptus TaxID=1391653 RepID=A0A0K1P910_9BACT|nr:sigma 54-interacting transcriptional regulator [Vulgatibacter incomptus]AKU90010.1 Nitrogenase (molybdenum-iron)-specific transcriptional regulator NifA [Vulgatibacter incomptus]